MSTYDVPPDTFDALVAPHSELVQQTASTLRNVVRAVMPDAIETVTGGRTVAHAFFSLDHPSNIVCVIQPAADHCKLYVHRLRPSDSVALRLDGEGKNTRHVKVGNPAAARSQRLQRALTTAVNLARMAS